MVLQSSPNKLLHPNRREIPFCAGCETCPLRGRKVGPRGNIEAPIVIVGESPGRNELREGIPFVGDSGDVLRSVVPDWLDFDRDFYITNAMQCQPKEKDPHILKSCAKSCQERLLLEIYAHPRQLIIALGNAALWTLTDDFTYKITQARGKPIESHLAPLGVFPAVHPAALLRGTSTYRQFRQDMEYAFSLVDGFEEKHPVQPSWLVVDTKEEVKKVTERLKNEPILVADTETTGLDTRHDMPLCLGVCVDPSLVYVFPRKMLRYLGPLFSAKKPKWVWHNGKFDITFFRRRGFKAKVDHDTMLMSYALDETGGIHGLEVLAKDLLGSDSYKFKVKDIIGKEGTFADLPEEDLWERVAEDTSYTRQIFDILWPQVRADKHTQLEYEETLLPASECLYHVEKWGIYVNDNQVLKNDKTWKKKIEVCEKELNEVVGYELNPNSPKQVAAHLYDELGLKPGKKRTTGKDYLETLPQKPAVKKILEYRKLKKAHSTYIVGVMKKKHADDNRIHTTYKIHGTRTGRLSSEKPNVQNIPREPDLKNMFMAQPGFILLDCDFNQAELRSLAEVSRDVWLTELYNSESRSLHDEMAAHLFGEDYTNPINEHEQHEYKMKAKMVNFGIVYGREAPSIADQFSIPISEAQYMIDGWFERCPEAHDFIKWCRESVKSGRTLITPFGRKKRHHLVSKSNYKSLCNEAANFPHQSIASDLNLHAAIRVRPIIEKMGAHLCNLVHDSTVIECPEAIVDEVESVVLREMEQVPREWGLTRVVFKAEAKRGYSWGSVKEVDLKKAA